VKGGGIYNAGEVFIYWSIITRNKAINGGGIYNSDPGIIHEDSSYHKIEMLQIMLNTTT
jgi:hypothetical protein